MHTKKHKNHKNHYKNNKTNKVKYLPNLTPTFVDLISQNIQKNTTNNVSTLQINLLDKPSSYSPTVNQELVTLQSMSRQTIHNCNNDNAFKLQEPLKIAVGQKCVPYYEAQAIKFLLKNLAANKHIDTKIIITPMFIIF